MQEEEQVFTIYVVGMMATGKSTLINAMLGKKLMPYDYASHSLICIEHANNNELQGVAYDMSKHEIMKDDYLTRHILQEWNDDERISFINVKGIIPFVSSFGGRVRIVEVSTWNKKDYFEFLQNINCERTLVVNVVRGDCSLGNDDCELIQHICEITRCNTQFLDRYIFAITKMDVFNPEEESVEYALAKIKTDLENRGIFNPKIFPVSAQAALEARTKPTIELVLPVYKQYIKCFSSTHFDNYYHYSHLPSQVRIEMERCLREAATIADEVEKERRLVEIHSGIISIESAINTFIINRKDNNN